MRRLLLFVIIMLPMLLASCDGSVYYDESRPVDEYGWQPADSVCFDVEVDDTNRIFNFLFEVRNSVSYPYSTTFLFIRTSGSSLALSSYE